MPCTSTYEFNAQMRRAIKVRILMLADAAFMFHSYFVPFFCIYVIEGWACSILQANRHSCGLMTTCLVTTCNPYFIGPVLIDFLFSHVPTCRQLQHAILGETTEGAKVQIGHADSIIFVFGFKLPALGVRRLTDNDVAGGVLWKGLRGC